MAESIEVPNITAPFIRVIYVHILTSLSEYEHLKDADRDPWVICGYVSDETINQRPVILADIQVRYTGLFETIVRVLTTCHTQCT